MFDTLQRDLSQAWRGLFRQPTTTLAIIATIALVVGAGTSILAVVTATLVRPLPYPDQDRLIGIYTQPPGTTRAADRNPLHALDFVRFRQHLRLADAVEGAWSRDRSLGADGDPVSVPAAQVSPGFLPLLGGRLAAGRIWTDAEDRAAARVVVLAHGLWLRQFGGQPVLGRLVSLDRERFEVIGILAADLRPPGFAESDLWTPLGIHEGNLPLPRATFIQTIARLAPGAGPAQLGAEVATAMARIAETDASTHAGWTAGLVSLRELRFGDNRRALALLGGAVLVLAFIAGANLTNLLLARVVAERHEISLRVALGASRGDLVRLHAIEAAILALTGGGLGVMLAAFALPALLALDPAGARSIGPVPLEWRVLSGAAAFAFAIVFIAGLPPVLREVRTNLTRRLGHTGGRTTSSRRNQRLRRRLVAAEAALAVVLLVSSALVTASLVRTSHTDLGFDPTGVVAGQLRLPEAAYPTTAARTSFVTTVLERVRALPGVLGAGTTLNPFVPGFSFVTLIDIDGRPTPDGSQHTVQFRRVTPGFFRAMRIREVAGRTFSDADRPDSAPVVVVSEAFAKRFWMGEDAVGRRIKRASATLTVIGVVSDVRDLGAGVVPDATLYVPYAQNNNATALVTLVVRVAGEPVAAAPMIRAAILSIDPDEPLDDVTTVESFLADTLGPDRFRSTLLGLFGVLGLLLACVGIYGVTARLVEERAREIGIRRVFGASPTDVWRRVVGQATSAVAWGAAAGSVGAGMAAGLLHHFVPNLAWADAWAAGPAAVALAASAVVAAGVPALRAARLDPAAVLRGATSANRAPW